MEIIKARRKYYKQKFSKSSETQDKFIDYRFLNELEGGASGNNNIPYLLQSGRRIDENLKIPNELKTVFVRIGQKLKEHNPNEIFFSS